MSAPEAKSQKLPNEAILFTDGASRGNPGPAAIGVVITSTDGKIVLEYKKTLGLQTNNYAEYTALLEGLLAAAEGGVKKLTVKADSQFMIRQMLGEYKVKAENIIPLYKQCRKVADLFDFIDFIHVPRDQNKEADRLANEALDGE